MANKEKDQLYERLPDLDYRFDMRQYEAFIHDLQGEYETDPAQTGGGVFQHGLTAYVPVIFGCNEVCSFCIVPFVRGTERSRPLTDVVEDVRRFALQGVREVTLLGQTVNSYRDPETKAGLSALLEAVERALHAAPAFVENVGVDHRGRHIRVTQQLLHRADVVAAFQEVRREGVA